MASPPREVGSAVRGRSAPVLAARSAQASLRRLDLKRFIWSVVCGNSVLNIRHHEQVGRHGDTVFNVQQCDGLEEHAPVLTDPDRLPFSPIERCEGIVGAMPARSQIRRGGRQAFYQLLSDAVTTPDRELFGSEVAGPRPAAEHRDHSPADRRE